MSNTLPTEQPERSISVDDHGRMNYSGAAETGNVEVELPTPPGSVNPTERLLAKDFGAHVTAKIQSAFDKQGYLRSGPQQSPAATFRHFVSAAKGAELLDRATLPRMDEIAAEFSKMPNKPAQARAYFAEVVRPWLRSLSPGKR